MRITAEFDGKTRHVDASSPIEVSIPLKFDGPQPRHFGEHPASARPMQSGEFIGDTREGGSCNAEVYSLNAHCNGTHTECVGHVTDERAGIRALIGPVLVPARLISVTPNTSDGEAVITRKTLIRELDAFGPTPGLLIRTLPNDASKLDRDYGLPPLAPWLDVDAVEYLVERGVAHLLVDLPSIDRVHDEGRLAAHRVFWGMDAGDRKLERAKRPHATVTELIYVPDEIADELYLLDLQVAPFMTDAAPSRPVLYPLIDDS